MHTLIRKRRWYSPVAIARSISIRPRVYLGAAVGIALLWFLPKSIPLPVRETTAWCLGALTYLGLAFRLMIRCHSDRIKLRAGVHDDSGILILALILLAIFSSFSAIFGLLIEAKQASDQVKMLYVGLATGTIFISWMVMQVAFAIHYAHQYYRPQQALPPGTNGLDFPKVCTPIIGTSSTSRRRSAPPRKPPMSPSTPKSCDASRPCTPLSRSSSTLRWWR